MQKNSYSYEEIEEKLGSVATQIDVTKRKNSQTLSPSTIKQLGYFMPKKDLPSRD